MFDWSLALPILLNTIVVSIPEQVFLIMFAFILMRRFDFLEFRKVNILRFVAVVIPGALLSNILRGFAGFNMNFMPLIGITSSFLLILAVFRIRSFRGILKAFISVTISFLVVLAIQLLYFPFIIYGTSITMDKLNQFNTLNWILSVIDRVIQVCIIGLLFLRKRSFMKMNFFKVIARNKALAHLSAVISTMNLVFIYIMCMLVYFDKILINLRPTSQLLIIVAIVSFPVINMSAFLGVINYSVNKYTHTRVYVQEESRVLRVLVRLLLQQRRYDEIDSELESFESELKKIK